MNTKDVEIWQGDCLERVREIADGSVDAIITDPPYGMNYQSARRIDSQRKPRIANDTEPFVSWLPDAFRVLKDGGSLACFHTWQSQEQFRSAIESAGFTVRSQLVWDREMHGMADPQTCFAPQHDLVWFAAKGRFTFHGKRPTSVLRFQRVAANRLMHPNEKPLSLLVKLVTVLCPQDGLVLDPFSGSGTTLVACMKTGRRCIGIELDPKYIPIIERRIKAAETPLFSGFDDMEAAS